jgi:tripartite-type tricarboxylate transporter receptor subunit TctC
MKDCARKLSGSFVCLLVSMFILGAVAAPSADAEDVYPKKRITFICYVKPGGGFDILARSVMPYLEKHLKEISKDAKGGGVVVKNVPAAGGRKAYSTIFNADPDGYTIGDFNSAFATEEIAAKSKLKFDYTQFTFLVRLGVSKRIILAKKGTFKNWDEMIQASKKRELKWAASNFGRGHHVSCILLKEAANMNVKLINFPGAAENINSLMRGDVDMAIATLESAVPMIQAGEFIGLAVLSDKSEVPGVPSIKDLGYPEIADMLQLHRIFIAPPNLDKEAYDKLLAAFKKVFADPEFLAQAKKINFEPEPIFGEDAAKLMKQLFNDYLGQAEVLKKYLAQ